MKGHTDKFDLELERAKLARGGQLHWIHWIVIALSLALTISAWQVSKNQIEEKIANQFERESTQVIALISERMQKYEDALWGGVGAIQTTKERKFDAKQWFAFSQALKIDSKYPGINGIGIINYVRREGLSSYLSEKQEENPNFHIHPSHDNPEYMPIAYIEPVASNAAAIGLDMAHEAHRYTAAKKARDTGTAQITAPIILVQDTEKTPGFLFFAPYYKSLSPPSNVPSRRDTFAGIVYAPFIVHKLMKGVLAQDQRHVDIRIRDEKAIIYEDLLSSDWRNNSKFFKSETLDLYGRTWTFDIWANASFQSETRNHQPLTILVGGLCIDAMLLGLFFLLSKSNRNALSFAQLMSSDLQKQAAVLKQSNEDLENFAHIASHDLQEPLRMIASYTQLLAERYREVLDEKGKKYVAYVTEGVQRMHTLLSDLLSYSRSTQDGHGQVQEWIEGTQLLNEIKVDLSLAIQEAEADIKSNHLPAIWGIRTQIRQVLQNAIGNALKFRGNSPARIEISGRVDSKNRNVYIDVKDYGIGIAPENDERVFTIFHRLHPRRAYPGNGVGLAICKKIILRHGGTVKITSKLGQWTILHITLPYPAKEQHHD